MAKYRIGKPGLAQFDGNPLVAETIRLLGTDYKISSFTTETRAANLKHMGIPAYGLYLSEGSRFVVIYNGEVSSVATVSADTMGASGVSYDVGKTAPLPVGAVIVEVSYYARYWMTVTTVTDPALAAKN